MLFKRITDKIKSIRIKYFLVTNLKICRVLMLQKENVPTFETIILNKIKYFYIVFLLYTVEMLRKI